MTLKHTPGPWRIEGTRILGANGDTVIDCRGAMSGDDTQADKRLIVEAPAMRDRLTRTATVLSTAASYIARDTDTGIADSFEAEANEIRALLARIDGEDR